MRILFIMHFPPPVHGAAMVGGFIKQSEVLNSAFECRYINLGLSLSVEEIGGNIAGKVFRYIGMIRKVMKQLVFSRPNLCYLAITAQGIGFYKDALIVLIVKLFGVKTVYHFHNKGITNRKVNFLENLLYRIVFLNSDFILISARLYYDFRNYVPGNRAHYCTNGIPDGEGQRAEGTGLRAQGSGRRAEGEGLKAKGEGHVVEEQMQVWKGSDKVCQLLFLSNLIESKGIFILLEACKVLKDKNINFHCTFVGGEGDVPVQLFMSKVNEYSLGNCVSYAGKKYGTDKEEFFLNADVFVHPSYLDCLPLVLLEAMQHSLPVVSTYEGAIPDAVDNGINGFLVQQKDPEALAEKLEILIKNPALRISMGKAGREKYEREFTLNRFENRLTEILRVVGVR